MIREYVAVIAEVAATLEPGTEDITEREEKFEALIDRFEATEDPIRHGMATVMLSFLAGLFVGEEEYEAIRDNLDLERWFRLPKSHERRIHGHRHAGIRLVLDGPTLVHCPGRPRGASRAVHGGRPAALSDSPRAAVPNRGAAPPHDHEEGAFQEATAVTPGRAGAALSRNAGVLALSRTVEKKSRRAAEQDRPELKAERAAWRQEFAAVDPTKLVFVDESGASTAMDRTHGRAPSGMRGDGPVPQGHWKVTTLTAAVRLDGVPESACLAFDGATDAACFEAYVEHCLAPALRPGDVVIMDNLACHKTAEVARLIEAAGASVRYLPAYSPDLNPIEKDQADSTSSDRWCEAADAGYDRRLRTA